jgi:outer membrane lipoprotein-sorting protein
MRHAGVTATVAALFVGSTLAVAAQNVPVPAPSPKKPQGAAQSTQPPRPAAPVPQAAVPLPAPFAGPAAPQQPGQFDGSQRALIDRISNYLSNVQTLVGDFVQVGPDGRRNEGHFYIQKPGRVRFEYNPPSPIDVVSNGDVVVVRDRNLATQDLYPLSQTPLRYLLADRIDLLRDTNVVSLSADDTFVTIVVEEKHLVVGTTRLMMMFGARDLQLRQWTVTDPQGYDTTVAVYNLDASKKPDPSMFKVTYSDRPDPR